MYIQKIYKNVLSTFYKNQFKYSLKTKGTMQYLDFEKNFSELFFIQTRVWKIISNYENLWYDMYIYDNAQPTKNG